MLSPGIMLLTVCMLLTGAINTISTKFQDMVVVGHDESGPLHFQHPVMQSACMFFGEFLCLVPHFISVARARWAARRARSGDGAGLEEPLLGASPSAAEPDAHRLEMKTIFAFALPACCDALATTLLNVGLFYTQASTYQMLRGTLVLFAGFFTVVLLKRTLHLHHWSGMVLIVVGAALVGTSSVVYSNANADADAAAAAHGALLQHSWAPHPDPATHHVLGPLYALRARSHLLWRSVMDSSRVLPLIGDVLVVAAQMATALQFIVEEKYLKMYRVPPLLAVGLEGFWGMVLSAIALPALTFIKGEHGRPIDDAWRAIEEIQGHPGLLAAVVGSVVSIAFFNFFGISVTVSLSGAARATIDACRTLLIWMFALAVGWERFHMLEVLGFVVLLSGSSLYNELFASCLPVSALRRKKGPRSGQPPGDSVDGRSGRPPLHPGTPSAATAAAARPQAIRGLPAKSNASMVRSMRVGPHIWSPHSIGSVGGASFSGSELGVSFTPSDRQDWANALGSTPLSPAHAMPVLPASSSSLPRMPAQPMAGGLSLDEETVMDVLTPAPLSETWPLGDVHEDDETAPEPAAAQWPPHGRPLPVPAPNSQVALRWSTGDLTHLRRPNADADTSAETNGHPS